MGRASRRTFARRIEAQSLFLIGSDEYPHNRR
jgi:hypothetical protein